MTTPTSSRRCYATVLTALALAASQNQAEAFSTLSFSSSKSTALNLVPEQGQQLKAWAAAHSVTREEEEGTESLTTVSSSITEVEEHHNTRLGNARAFVHKVFHLPATLKNTRRSCEDVFAWDSNGESLFHEVVYYPIVGFKFCDDAQGHSRALPTTHCESPKCSLPPVKEELVGYWSHHACRLEDPFSDNYCQEPKEEQVLPAP